MARIAKAPVAGAKGKEKARANAPSARRKPVPPEPQKDTKEQNPNNIFSPTSVKKSWVSWGLLFFIFLALIGGTYLGYPKWYSKIADHFPSWPILKTKDPRFAVVNERVAALETKTAVLKTKDETASRLQQRYEKLSENNVRTRRRVGLLEKSLADVSIRLAMLTRGNRAAEIKDNFQRARERLTELEKNQANITSAGIALVDFEQRLRTLEESGLAAIATGKTDTAQTTAILLAISQLRYMAGRGVAYEREFETFKALAAGSASIGKLLPSLETHAKIGVTPRTILRKELGEIAGTMVAKARNQSAEHWFSNLAARVGTLVTIRRIDGGEIGSVENLVASAEAQLKVGNLAAAIEAVKSVRSVSSDAASVAADWLKRAEARRAIEHALALLNNDAISLLGRTIKE